MKKITIKFGVIAIITFFVFFAYFYKNSGKFRKSSISAFMAITVILSIPRPVRSGQAEVDAFTQQSQQHRNRPQKQGIFSRSQKKMGQDLKSQMETILMAMMTIAIFQNIQKQNQ